MSLTNPTRPDAPIPGANYTSDTRNYPWHRPPDITDVDEALEHVMERLTETDDGKRYMSIIASGTPIVDITDIVVTLAIGRGKITTDFAILISGPVTRMIEIMAKSYGVTYTLGIDREDSYITAAAINGRKAVSAPPEDVEEVPLEETPVEEEGGLMSAVSEEEQASMLGYEAEEIDEDE